MSPRTQPPVSDADRLFNGRVLLEFAAQEIAAARPVDADELEMAIQATGDVLEELCEASRTLSVTPPELPELESWARRVSESPRTV